MKYCYKLLKLDKKAFRNINYIMSRVGKNPVILTSGVTANYNEANRNLTVKGSLGELDFNISKFVNLEITATEIIVTVNNPEEKLERALWGTVRAIIQNMVNGVSTGYEKVVELNGVGFRMELANDLTCYLGFSHPVIINIPSQISLNLEKNVLKGKCIDKQLLGNFFSNLHNLKPCDVYKQKGFKFPGRFYRKKVGKKGK